MLKSIPIAIAAMLALAGSANAALVISGAPTSNVSCAAGICTATAADAVLNDKDLKRLLVAGDVKVVSGSAAQDIVFNAKFKWTKRTRLTLDAYRSIVFKLAVVAEGPGAVTLTTNDGGSGGDYSFTDKGKLTFWDTSSSLIINGTAFVLVNDIATLAADVESNPSGSFALNNFYDASGQHFKFSPIQILGGTFEGLGHVVANLKIENFHKKQNVGFVGQLGGTVRDISLTNAQVSGGDFRDDIGGLVGVNEGYIIGAHVSGNLSGGGVAFVGGLAGMNNGYVVRSSSSTNVAGGLCTGGLVGQNNWRISQSFSTGSVAGGYYIGGLAGCIEQATSTMQSYSTASVRSNGETEYMGGLAGTYDYDFGEGSADQVFATGLLSPAAGRVGGLLGGDGSSSNGISSAYWDLDTSGVGDPSQGSGNLPNDPGITGFTDTQLKSGLPVGFDPSVWGQSPSINNGYPYLLSNPPPQ